MIPRVGTVADPGAGILVGANSKDNTSAVQLSKRKTIFTSRNKFEATAFLIETVQTSTGLDTQKFVWLGFKIQCGATEGSAAFALTTEGNRGIETGHSDSATISSKVSFGSKASRVSFSIFVLNRKGSGSGINGIGLSENERIVLHGCCVNSSHQPRK